MAYGPLCAGNTPAAIAPGAGAGSPHAVIRVRGALAWGTLQGVRQGAGAWHRRMGWSGLTVCFSVRKCAID